MSDIVERLRAKTHAIDGGTEAWAAGVSRSESELYADAADEIERQRSEIDRLRAENAALRDALHNLVATIQSLPEDIEGYIETLDEPMAVAVNLIAKR